MHSAADFEPYHPEGPAENKGVKVQTSQEQHTATVLSEI